MMTKPFQAIFDGQVLRPEEPVDLQPQAHYLVTVEAAEKDAAVSSQRPHPLSELLALATDMGIEDLAARHQWYAHGYRALEDEENGAAP